MIRPHISFETNDWSYNENINMVASLWFDRLEFLPSNIKRKHKVRMNPTIDGYDTDAESRKKTLPPVPKTRRKSNLVKIQEREIFESN